MLQINMNQSFVFQISKISVLTVFRFFRRRYWIDDINRKHCFAIKFETKKLNDKSRQFQENCQKNKRRECVELKSIKTVVTSSNQFLFQILRERSFQYFAEEVCSKFYMKKFGPKYWQLET